MASKFPRRFIISIVVAVVILILSVWYLEWQDLQIIPEISITTIPEQPTSFDDTQILVTVRNSDKVSSLGVNGVFPAPEKHSDENGFPLDFAEFGFSHGMPEPYQAYSLVGLFGKRNSLHTSFTVRAWVNDNRGRTVTQEKTITLSPKK